MDYLIRNLKSSDIYQQISKNKKGSIKISGLVCVAKSILASTLNMDEKKNILLITYNELQAKKIYNDLKYFTDDVSLFNKREISLYDIDAESNEIEKERIKVLNKIQSGDSHIIVTTIEAVMQKMIAREELYENVIEIKNNSTISLDEIKEKLLMLGYERKELVENEAEYSIRGDIIDIALTDKVGIRIELWGDDVDSIRKFNIASQRSTETIDHIEIYPATEKVLETSLENVAKKIEEKSKFLSKDLEEIREGNYASKIDRYFNDFYDKQESILEYAKDYVALIDEEDKIEQRIQGIQEDIENLSKDLIEKEKLVPQILNNMLEFDLKDIEKIENQKIYLKEADSRDNNFRLREVNVFNGDIKKVIDEANEGKQQNKKVIILAGTSDNRDLIAKQLEGSIKLDNTDDIILKGGQIAVSKGSISSGFEDKKTNLLVISSNEFTNENKRKAKKSSNTFKSSEKIVFADLKVGELVVHRNFGVGVFTGVKTITTDGATKDYIGIKYRDGDSLFVPTTNIDVVRKYIGSESGIRLNKLGTKEWKETKAKVKGNLKMVAKELIELYAKREKARGFAFSPDTPWQKEFEDSFPFQETDDQLRCIEEVKKDMENDKPMDRLLCGDVGYGKTEVAIRACFKAVMDGKQVAYLAPTTILADQQYKEFKERMKNFPIRIDVLNRFKTAKEQRETVKKLKEGKIDVIVGTHRLLSKDVEFNNLGLLIIDEEQRFGVKAKEKIKQYKANVDVLTMTATPIPRTLQMSIVGIRDMSVIYEPPHNRKPIQTYVLEYDREIIREAITKELERDGQVFYIYNNVQGISKKAIEIEEMIPDASVSYAHGQMTGAQIEEIMQDFIDKKTNVLVCTTILESGIDIPNANTIIVENADRFGLAQLYQIRGRVGRSNKQAFAYITYRKDKIISEDATQRLKAIKEFTEFGSGFKIATRDLQIRGAGSLFGEVQSGHMEQVGYDMYNKLLDEVVKETKGEQVVEEEEILIDINLSAYIPDKYIEDSSQKIEIYQDIADCKTEEDIQNIIDEIIDRYGDMPREVDNLMEVARIKNAARNTNVTKIQERPMGIVFTVKDIDNDKLEELINEYRNNIRFSAGEKPYVTLTVKENKIKEIIKFLNFLAK